MLKKEKITLPKKIPFTHDTCLNFGGSQNIVKDFIYVPKYTNTAVIEDCHR